MMPLLQTKKSGRFWLWFWFVCWSRVVYSVLGVQSCCCKHPLQSSDSLFFLWSKELEPLYSCKILGNSPTHSQDRQWEGAFLGFMISNDFRRLTKDPWTTQENRCPFRPLAIPAGDQPWSVAASCNIHGGMVPLRVWVCSLGGLRLCILWIRHVDLLIHKWLIWYCLSALSCILAPKIISRTK